jgi:hypothetical protein
MKSGIQLARPGHKASVDSPRSALTQGRSGGALGPAGEAGRCRAGDLGSERAPPSSEESWFRHDFSRVRTQTGTHGRLPSHDFSQPQTSLTEIVRRTPRDAVLRDELMRTLGSGEALTPPTRDRVHLLTGEAPTDIRIHRDERSQRNVDMLDSAALTIGSDILLGSRAASRPTPDDWLLAHEIGHAIQQHPDAGRHSRSPSTGNDLELEADAFANAFSTSEGRMALTRSERSIAEKVIWKYLQDLPGDLLLIIDVDDGDFVGGCVKQYVPHAGVKLIKKAPHAQLFNLHVGFLTNAAGESCVFFYESVTRICEMKCFPSREELRRRWSEVVEWIKEQLVRLLKALLIAVFVVALVALAWMIAQAIAAALLVLA